MDPTVQITHKGQHLLKHKASEIKYNNQSSPGIKDVGDAIDTLFQLSTGVNWKDPVQTHADLPTVGNTLNDVRVVQDDDGMGTTVMYVCVATVGGIDTQWQQIAVVNQQSITFDPGTNDGDLLAKTSASTIGKVTGFSALLEVSAHTLATFTNSAGTQEKGSTLNNFNLNWTYNRNSDNPASQSIDNGVGALATNLRTKAVSGAGLTTSTTYTISAVGDDASYGAAAGNNTSLQTTIPFLNRRYYGVSQNSSLNNGQVLALSGLEFASVKPVSKTFDASGGGGNNYLYICYPASLGAPSAVTLNGFAFTDYTASTQNVTNASGFTESFYIIRTNQVYSGSNIIFAITS